jgi:diadenosine tetraphosphatase ApaH/serine/threonine PP2A family protein phosphatase
VCLIGNHDLAVLGQIPLSRFNQDAHDALAWTTNTLSPEHRDFLASLPPLVIKEPFTLAHGSPRQPVWEYILDRYTAERNFDEMTSDYALVGHSHLPLMLRRAGEDAEVVPLPLGWAQPTALTPKMILNPGSVGQPRDLDPRAAYAILDLEAQTWEPRRVDYAIDRVQSRMVELGLPQRLALRLAAGM